MVLLYFCGMTAFAFTPEFASQMDFADPLKAFRDEFIFPQHQGKDVLYFTGNSLGLQPKAARKALKLSWKTGQSWVWKDISKAVIPGNTITVFLPIKLHA